ncbi:riboflavin kinase [Brevibacillus daliensis]|uniref:riboflavin kinase n=1 Tax=Brevibacillus daliensis TaxID=2892995 RepID=UPI001E5A2562|nr:riboflavin kinase [Brevibacillus daliensis]
MRYDGIKLSGRVVHGRQIGKKMGFPTANLIMCTAENIPFGVYGVRVMYQGRMLLGVMNVGTRPTFEDDSSVSYEIHLLGFSQMIYGEILEVEICFMLREERRFSSVKELVMQIEEDVRRAQQFFGNNEIDFFHWGKERRIHGENDNSIVHLMDLAFFQHCEREYGVNKGVYNTIDAWFYEQGITNILARRQEVVSFLQYVGVIKGSNERLRFGRGKLREMLTSYVKFDERQFS